jgi:tRNA A-37 threonylcarbamoyl transferase component Bud32
VGGNATSQVEEQSRARLGTTVGLWYVQKIIGVGAMATVYAAAHGNDKTRAALKILHPVRATSEKICTRFMREGRIANAVGHTGAVSVLDQGRTEDGCPFLVMELLEGETVADIASRLGTLPLTQALGVADQVLDILDAAHRRGIVHRDVKPSNIIITRNRTLKLLDFGIASLRDAVEPNKTAEGTLVGTPTYMPPEQALGRAEDIGPHTDVWAVGAVIFRLLSGHTVHQGKTPAEILVAAATRPARSLAEVMPQAPVELVMLVDKSLAYDAKDRFPSAKEFRQEIRTLAQQRAAQSEQATGDSRTAPAASGPPTNARAPEAPATARGRALARLEGLHFRSVSDQDVTIAARCWEHLEGALTSRMHYGPDHPQSIQIFDRSFSQLRDLLESAPAGILWSITPYAFVVGEEIIWEPRDRLDWIPYRAFASGIRILGLLPNLARKELAELLDLLTLDPRSEMAAEDDLVTMLWERDFPNIIYREADSFSEGDQAALEAFERQRKEIIAFVHAARASGVDSRVIDPSSSDAGMRTTAILEEVGSERARAHAMAKSLSAEDASIREEARSQLLDAVTLDPAELSVLRAQLAKGEGTTGERFLHAAAQGYVWARGAYRSDGIEEVLAAQIVALTELSPTAALEFLASLCTKIQVRDPMRTRVHRAALATTLLTVDLVQRAAQEQRGLESADERLASAARHVFSLLDESMFSDLLDAAPELRPGVVLNTLLAYVQKFAPGSEPEIAATISQAPSHLAIGLLRVLASVRTRAAYTAILSAFTHPDHSVRIEALARVYGNMSDRVLEEQVRRLLAERDGAARQRLLICLQQHEMTRTAPILDEHIRAASFDALPVEERTLALKVLASLAPDRAEQAAIELLADSRFLSTPSHEQTRALAAEALMTVGRTQRALDTLESLAGQRIGSSKAVKTAVAGALGEVRRRVGGPT